jgi:hypothetical protein
MLEEVNDEKEIQVPKNLQEINEIEKSTLVGFFAKLIEVDKRNNPELYKKMSDGQLLI